MLLEVPSSFKQPNGKWSHHIRQSDLNRFLKCPDLHRRYLHGLVEDQEGDAAIVGTACHEAYAQGTTWLRTGRDDWTAGDVLSVGHTALERLWRAAEEQDVLRQMQVATIDEAHDQVAGCMSVWVLEVLPMLAANIELIETIEYRFDIKAYEDSARIIYIAGTWDLGMGGALYDYKHSNGQKYTTQKAWQTSRYDAQPTIYAWAHDMLFENEGAQATLMFADECELADFTFINITRDKFKLQFLGPKEGIKVRTVGDCRFALQQMLALCHLIESDIPVWPLGAADWWCSSKWCPAWNDCRGKFIGEDPWHLLERAEQAMEKRR